MGVGWWLAEEKKAFELWHRFKDNDYTRETIQSEMRAAVKSLGEALLEGSDSQQQFAQR